MDVYEYAMQMEKDGESYYRELTEKIGNRGLKRILSMLADAEVIHYNILLKMKKSEKIEVADASILTDVKNIFIKMKEEKEITGINISQVELYKKAQQIEEKSQIFYLDKAGEVKDLLQKEIFLKIAEEEKKHFFILESIIDFVSQPQRWLEDAEWYHLEEY